MKNGGLCFYFAQFQKQTAEQSLCLRQSDCARRKLQLELIILKMYRLVITVFISAGSQCSQYPKHTNEYQSTPKCMKQKCLPVFPQAVLHTVSGATEGSSALCYWLEVRMSLSMSGKPQAVAVAAPLPSPCEEGCVCGAVEPLNTRSPLCEHYANDHES